MSAIYQDQSVTITDQGIIIRKYYFPFENAKHIDYKQIIGIQIKDDLQQNLEWGLHPTDKAKWFNKDDQRQNKPKYIELTLKQQQTKPCFSPDDCKKVLGIVKSQMAQKGLSLTQPKLKNQQNQQKPFKKESQQEKDDGRILKQIPVLQTNADHNLFTL